MINENTILSLFIHCKLYNSTCTFEKYIILDYNRFNPLVYISKTGMELKYIYFLIKG